MRTAIVYLAIASVFQMRRDHRSTCENCDNAIAILSRLVDDNPEDLLYRLELAAAHSILGLEFHDHGQPGKASAEFARALEQFRRADRLAPGHDRVLNNFTWFLCFCPDPNHA